MAQRREIELHPPAIYHSEKRPACYVDMVKDCARNIHLRGQATELLLFYAGRSNGFTPALAMIEQNTRITKNKISEIRQKLVDHGLIAYSREQRYIYIAWNRIRAFAMLEEPLRITRGKCQFFPVEAKRAVIIKKDIRISRAGRKYKIKNPCKLSKDEKKRFAILGRMKESEYSNMVKSIRNSEFPQMPRPPDTS